MPGLQARFREEKHLTLLREPLVSQGVLYFAPPGRLARHVHDPAPSRLLVEEDRLSYQSARERGEIDLDVQPMVRAFVDAFRLLLSGNLEGLREVFRIEFQPVGEPADQSWKVVLEPLHEPLRSSLESIQMAGSRRTLSELRIVERNGDETRMVFSSIDSERHFTESELSGLFRLPPS
jgi:hypothetical protein